MKGYALLLSIATATGCDYFPPGLPGADAGSVFDAGALDASTDEGDSGPVRDGGAPGDIDGGGAPVDILDAAVALDATTDAGDAPFEDSGVTEDGGAPSAACDAPPWILARCGVREHRHRRFGALLPGALTAPQLACVERWLATLAR